MKILFLAWNYPPAIGGIESVAVNLREGLVQMGHSVFTIARHSAKPEKGSAVIRPPTQGFASYLRFAYSASMRYMSENEVDAIVCSGISCAPVAWFLRLRRGVPYVLLAHGSDVEHGGIFYRLVMKFLFRKADGVPANSANTMRLLEAIGCEKGRIRIVHPGVEDSGFPERTPERSSMARKRAGLEGKKVLLSAGRLIRRKGIPEFVAKVAPELCKRHPELVFVVAGGDATASLSHPERLLDKLKEQVSDLGLSESVKVLGSVSDEVLEDLYYAADLFVLPAIPVDGDVEGFGIVFLEAALAGAPAVASRLGGIPEAVEDGVSGYVIDAGDWAGYIKVIGDLLADAEKIQSLARTARQRVLERFTWRSISSEYADFIGDTAGRAK